MVTFFVFLFLKLFQMKNISFKFADVLWAYLYFNGDITKICLLQSQTQ